MYSINSLKHQILLLLQHTQVRLWGKSPNMKRLFHKSSGKSFEKTTHNFSKKKTLQDESKFIISKMYFTKGTYKDHHLILR